jgi:LmbE family N-acetylglucosaminyl deacetylase
MGTLVCFHAHPDDECLTTGGTMARAAANGNRVVLVVATDGRHGESPDDLAQGEALVDRRRRETERSAAALGVDAIHWLGYQDSGMSGWDQNADPASFVMAPVEEAAERLAGLLRTEQADVVTIYDWHGNYGHPDHVKVHQVGRRAAELSGTPNVYEATMNRDEVERFADAAREAGIETPGETDDGNPFGMPEADLTTKVDVMPYLAAKRASFEAHASQVTDIGFFLRIPEDAFRSAFGTEWFIHVGEPPGLHEDWLAGLS